MSFRKIGLALAALGLTVLTVSAYAFTSITSLDTDVASARTQLADTKTQLADAKTELASTDAEIGDIRDILDSMRDKARVAEEKQNLAAGARKKVERDIQKETLIDMQKYSQVTDWKVHCVVANANTLNCLGEGYLDGDEVKTPYKATVDENGSFIWSYGGGE